MFGALSLSCLGAVRASPVGSDQHNLPRPAVSAAFRAVRMAPSVRWRHQSGLITRAHHDDARTSKQLGDVLLRGDLERLPLARVWQVHDALDDAAAPRAAPAAVGRRARGGQRDGSSPSLLTTTNSKNAVCLAKCFQCCSSANDCEGV